MVAFIIGGIVIWAAGGEPIRSYGHIVEAAFGSLGVFNDTLVKATPLILVGLACVLAFRMRLWNIGAEGQFFLGVWGRQRSRPVPAAACRTRRASSCSRRWRWRDSSCGVFGLSIPGYLKAKANVNEVVTTLMMNYIAASWVLFWVFGVWSEAGFQMSPMFPKNAWLPCLTDYAQQVRGFGGMTLHLGIVFGLLAAVVVWFIINRSRWGYEIRLIGDNPRVAYYAGVNIVRNTVLGDDVVGRVGWPGRYVGDYRRRPPLAGSNLAWATASPASSSPGLPS